MFRQNFQGSLKTAPNGSIIIKECLCILAILRSQIPEPFQGLGEKQLAFQRRLGLPALHQFVDPAGAGIAGRLMDLDVLIEVVGMEGAEQAAGSPGLNPQHLPVVSVAHGARPSHFHQRIAVYKEFQLTGLCPVALFKHNPHVHLMCVDIQAQGTLVWPVAQKISPNKPLNHFDLIFIGALTGHTSLFPILSYRPKRNTGNSAFPKFGDKVSI